MPFTEPVRIEALVKAARHCCICRRFRGTKIECHHIVQEADGGPDTLDNCIPLCFDCHSDMMNYDPKHPKGTKYRPTELRQHRDGWFAKVADSGVELAAPHHREADSRLFTELHARFPWNGTMQWLTEHDFGGSFPATQFNPFHSFDEDADDPARQFLDMELEALRADFVSDVRGLLASAATNLFALDSKGPTRLGLSGTWSDEQQERARQELNKCAHEVCKVYGELISTGRRKLPLG